MSERIVTVTLNQQQMELVERLCAEEGHEDAGAALRAGLQGYLALERAEAAR